MSSLRSRALGALSADRSVVFVCQGPSCSERGGPDFLERLREQLKSGGHHRRVSVCQASCMDNCPTGPNVFLAQEESIRTGLTPEEVTAQVEAVLSSEPGEPPPESGPLRREAPSAPPPLRRRAQGF